MKKLTHFNLALTLSDSLQLNFDEKMCLCLGSILPDLTPMCIIKPHKLSITYYKSLKRLYKISINSSDSCTRCLLIGCISHHLADYFTAPHNRDGVKGFCTNHRKYERELNDYFLGHLDSINKSDVMCLNSEEFWGSLLKLHEGYMSNSESYNNDFRYITLVVNTLYQLFINEEVENKGLKEILVYEGSNL